MPSKISIIPLDIGNFFGDKNNYNPGGEFYCKESPLEILTEFAGKCNLGHYKSIVIQNHYLADDCTHYLFGIDKGVVPAHGLSIDKSFYDYDFSKYFSKAEHDMVQNNKNEIISNLIKNYFLKKIIKQGPILLVNGKPKQFNTGHPYNYFEERKTKIDPKKEKNLEDFLDFTSALLKSS